jgi:branched-chain amino acid transport system ATP-binding protein
VIEIRDLHTNRGSNYVLQGVSLRIGDGACTVLLGRNGMGKTTLVQTIMGLLRPRSGQILLDDEEMAGKQPYQVAQHGLALVPQGRRIFPSLTVEENLTLAARGAASRSASEVAGRPRRGRPPSEGADERDHKHGADGDGGSWTLQRVYDLFPNLHDRRRGRGSQLSGGEQQMLAIGRALLTNPRLLLMDEPSEGLAPVIVERIGEILAGLRSQGLAIFLVEQNYRLAINSADSVYILSKGQIVWQGSPGELDRTESVREAHLGV